MLEESSLKPIAGIAVGTRVVKYINYMDSLNLHGRGLRTQDFDVLPCQPTKLAFAAKEHFPVLAVPIARVRVDAPGWAEVREVTGFPLPSGRLHDFNHPFFLVARQELDGDTDADEAQEADFSILGCGDGDDLPLLLSAAVAAAHAFATFITSASVYADPAPESLQTLAWQIDLHVCHILYLSKPLRARIDGVFSHLQERRSAANKRTLSAYELYQDMFM